MQIRNLHGLWGRAFWQIRTADLYDVNVAL